MSFWNRFGSRFDEFANRTPSKEALAKYEERQLAYDQRQTLDFAPFRTDESIRAALDNQQRAMAADQHRQAQMLGAQSYQQQLMQMQGGMGGAYQQQQLANMLGVPPTNWSRDVFNTIEQRAAAPAKRTPPEAADVELEPRRAISLEDNQ